MDVFRALRRIGAEIRPLAVNAALRPRQDGIGFVNRFARIVV